MNIIVKLLNYVIVTELCKRRWIDIVELRVVVLTQRVNILLALFETANRVDRHREDLVIVILRQLVQHVEVFTKTCHLINGHETHTLADLAVFAADAVAVDDRQTRNAKECKHGVVLSVRSWSVLSFRR